MKKQNNKVAAKILKQCASELDAIIAGKKQVENKQQRIKYLCFVAGGWLEQLSEADFKKEIE